jgi:hypothetical protein
VQALSIVPQWISLNLNSISPQLLTPRKLGGQ